MLYNRTTGRLTQANTIKQGSCDKRPARIRKLIWGGTLVTWVRRWVCNVVNEWKMWFIQYCHTGTARINHSEPPPRTECSSKQWPILNDKNNFGIIPRTMKMTKWRFRLSEPRNYGFCVVYIQTHGSTPRVISKIKSMKAAGRTAQLLLTLPLNCTNANVYDEAKKEFDLGFQ